MPKKKRTTWSRKKEAKTPGIKTFTSLPQNVSGSTMPEIKEIAPCSKSKVKDPEATPAVLSRITELASQGKANLESLKSSLKTLTFGTSASLNEWSSRFWIRHPLATDDRCYCIRVQIKSDCVRVSCDWMNSNWGISVEPNPDIVADEVAETGFVLIFSLRVFVKGEDGTRFHTSTSFLHMNACSCSFFCRSSEIFPGDAQKFFVSFSLSVLNDAEIFEALLSNKQPPTLPASQVTVPVVTKRLWEEREDTDLVVVPMGGEEINVHKCFLLASSPVLRAMFTHDTLEKQTGRWVVEDVPHNVMSEMLQFVYLETVSTSDADVLIQLLEVANRYDLPRLITATESILIGKLASDKTLGRTLLPVAHKLNLKNLKSASEENIMKHIYAAQVSAFLLATECSAERLQRLAAAFVLTDRAPPSQDRAWEKLESAHPELAQFLLKLYFDFSKNVTSEAEVVSP